MARSVSKLPAHPHLEARQGSIPEVPDLDDLLEGVDYVVAMLGDVQAQQTRAINTEFVEVLIPAMRRHQVARFLYQAGGLSAPPGQQLPATFRTILNTVARSYIGQHKDNEAVMRYLAEHAMDIQWMVHRAGIGSDGPSNGDLHRSETQYSIATFRDVAAYSHRILTDDSAVHTCDLSTYQSS